VYNDDPADEDADLAEEDDTKDDPDVTFETKRSVARKRKPRTKEARPRAGRERKISTKPREPVEKVQHIGDYTEDELKRLYLALRKYGDFSRFLHQIREAASLEDRPLEEITALSEWLEQEAADLSQGGVLSDTKRQRSMLEVTPDFKFKVDEFLLRILGMRELHTCLSNDPDWRISWLVGACLMTLFSKQHARAPPSPPSSHIPLPSCIQ
jgi:hypothetical protein